MSTANEEFEDLMPHRIEITGEISGEDYDDYGQPINNGVKRVYRCLLDDTTTEVRSADGTAVTVTLTAYVAPVPIGSRDGLPVDISTKESLRIVDPYDKVMNINSIERHYDSDMGQGMLHNLVVRMT